MRWPAAGSDSGAAYTSELLLDSAQHTGLNTVRQWLDTLFRLDAARWLGVDRDLPAARELERQALSQAPPPDTGGAAGRLLEASLLVRRRLREAEAGGGWDQAAAAIEALPAGYPIKSLWLHWRDLMLATGQTERWEALRRSLTAGLQRGGVPPSEALPALLGQLDLSRWRAEGRLLETVRGALTERLAQMSPSRLKPQARLSYGSAGGRFQVMLGDEVGGAQRVHETLVELPVVVRPAQARLFSRPVPEGALWLRRALEHAQASAETPDMVLEHALLALYYIALRHRAGHIITEALSPPPQLSRADAQATVLCYSALARRACGQAWESFEALDAGLRLVQRHPRQPLAWEPLLFAARWSELSRDYRLVTQLGDLCRRLTGAGQVVAEAEVARLCRVFGESDRGWETLSAAWRLALGLPPEGRAAGLIAVAGTLLAWERTPAAMAVLARVTAAGADEQPLELPHAVAAAADLVGSADELERLLGVQPAPLPAVVPATRVLLRWGHTRLATVAWQAALAEIDQIDDLSRRLRSLLGLVKSLLDGADLDLRAAVEQAVGDEAARILDRLRTDDPPRPGAHGAGR